MLELQSQGQTALVQPEELFQLCLLSGLIDPVASHLGSPEKVSAAKQRSLILTVALENHLVNLLTSCVSHWLDGMLNIFATRENSPENLSFY